MGMDLYIERSGSDGLIMFGRFNPDIVIPVDGHITKEDLNSVLTEWKDHLRTCSEKIAKLISYSPKNLEDMRDVEGDFEGWMEDLLDTQRKISKLEFLLDIMNDDPQWVAKISY